MNVIDDYFKEQPMTNSLSSSSGELSHIFIS